MSDVHVWPTLEKKPTRRVIIAGTRTYRGGVEGVDRAVKAAGFDIEVVLSGCARGADRAGEEWAKANDISIRRYPAQWDVYKKSAGMIRNAEMAANADALIALWDGVSPGTADMIERMNNRPTMVYWETGW